MTEAVNNFPPAEPIHNTVQCSLCLHEISYQPQQVERGAVLCLHCDYLQPVTKNPRKRDMVVFACAVGVVYVATIVAVLISR